MSKIIFHIKSSKRGELVQLLLIFGVSLLAAILGYTAVSWVSQIENQLFIALMAVGVTLIFCGVIMLFGGIMTLQVSHSDPQSASTTPKRSTVPMGLSSE